MSVPMYKPPRFELPRPEPIIPIPQHYNPFSQPIPPVVDILGGGQVSVAWDVIRRKDVVKDVFGRVIGDLDRTTGQVYNGDGDAGHIG